MSVLKSLTFLNAALTLWAVKSPDTLINTLTAMLASTNPIWLKLPRAMLGAYFFCTARYRSLSGPAAVVRFSSALTPSFPFHCGPSALARKSVLHGVEHAHF